MMSQSFRTVVQNPLNPQSHDPVNFTATGGKLAPASPNPTPNQVLQHIFPDEPAKEWVWVKQA